jgi:signal peptidase I
MENTQAPMAANWKPKPWVAVVLSIFVLPYSMLYLAKARLALYYFLAALVITIAEFWLLSTGATPWLKYASVGWLLNIACAIHSYKLARNEAFPLPRVWYSRFMRASRGRH